MTTTKQAWTVVNRSPKPNKSSWLKFVVPTLLPITIFGGLLATIASPGLKQRVVVLSLFMEPVDGTVEGVNGPHRIFPPMLASQREDSKAVTGSVSEQTSTDSETETDKDAKSPVSKTEKHASVKPVNELNDLDSLAFRLQSLRQSDNLLLFVSAVARIEQGRVLLLPAADRLSSSQKIYVQDLFRIINQSKSRQRLVVLDIQWPTYPEITKADQNSPETLKKDTWIAGSSSRPQNLHETLLSVVKQQVDQRTTYILTSGRNSWARGMNSPRQSAFLHFWRKATCTRAADSNLDGRLSAAEALAQVKQELAVWSSDSSQAVQAPIMVGDGSFDLGPIRPTDLSEPSTVEYPNWLRDAWQQRDNYLQRIDIASQSDFLDQWQQRLLAVESRWRRGIDDHATRIESEELMRWAKKQIGIQLDEAAARRPDSLWIAAKADNDTEQPQKILKIAEDIIANLEPIKLPSDDAAASKAIEQLLAPRLQEIGETEKLSLLDTLIDRLCREVAPSQPLALVSIELAKQLKVSDRYAETLVLEQITGTGTNIGDLDHALLRITRLRSRLGERPLLFAVMSPRLNQLLSECLTAEQFYRFDGFTIDANVRDQMMAALTRVEVGLSQQGCIEQAISTLERSLSFLRCGQALPDHEFKLNQILRNAERLSTVLYHNSASRESVNIDTAAVRFESIRYRTEQLQSDMELLIDGVNAKADVCNCDPLLSILPASMRPIVYQQLLSATRLHSFNTHSTHCVDDCRKNADPNNITASKTRLKSETSDLVQRITKIESTIREARIKGEEAMGAWLQRLSQTLAATYDPTGYYQALANRMRFRSRSGTQPFVSVEWRADPISWENSQAELLVKVLEGIDDQSTIKLTVLETASSSLKAAPTGTIATTLEPGRLQFELGIRSDKESPRLLKGVWLRCERSGHINYVPVRFPVFQSCRSVELSMQGNISKSTTNPIWRIWPKKSPQEFDWTLINHDDSPQKVIVTLYSGNQVILQSAPIAIAPQTKQPVRFPNTPTSKNKTATQQPRDSLKNIYITVVDAQSKKMLLERSYQLELVDVRGCIHVGESRFEVLSRGESNRLSVDLTGTPAADPQGHNVELALQPDFLPTLAGVGTGKASVEVYPHRSSETLRLRNLAIQEGPQAVWQIPLIVDGDAEVIRLNALTPYVRGQVNWQIDNQPFVFLDAAPASLPGSRVNAFIGGMNMPSSERLIVEFGQYDKSNFVVHHNTILSSPRSSNIFIDSGGATSTLRLQASYERWKVEIPTDQLDGRYQIRVRPIHSDIVLAKSEILLDSQEPIVTAATAFAEDPTKIVVQTIPGPSGISEVAMITDKSNRIVGVKQSSAEKNANLWTIQAKQPLAANQPGVVTIVATSNAGKTATFDLPVRLERRDSSGILEGVVVEGAIPQPRLEVTIRCSRGKEYKIRTDQDGGFRCSLPAGRYSLSVHKKATGRKAETDVEIQAGKTSPAQMELLLPKQTAQA